MEKTKLIKLTGIWENQNKKGETYFSGYLGSAKLIILKNGYKEEAKHPDYVAYIAEPQKKEDDEQAQSNNRRDELPF